MVRAVDSSLLDEWERMRTMSAEGEARAAPRGEREEREEIDVTRDERGFTVLVRNAMFQLLRALARKDWAGAAALVEGEYDFEAAMRPFYDEHASLRLDPAARAPANTRIEKTGRGTWEVTQIVCDSDDVNDWAVACTIDLDRSRADGHPVVVVRSIGAGR
jgi:hypothetical protein